MIKKKEEVNFEEGSWEEFFDKYLLLVNKLVLKYYTDVTEDHFQCGYIGLYKLFMNLKNNASSKEKWDATPHKSTFISKYIANEIRNNITLKNSRIKRKGDLFAKSLDEMYSGGESENYMHDYYFLDTSNMIYEKEKRASYFKYYYDTFISCVDFNKNETIYINCKMDGMNDTQISRIIGCSHQNIRNVRNGIISKIDFKKLEEFMNS